MISFFSSFKAIGLSIHQYTLKYALISKNKNEFTILEARTIDLTCKTALHSVQSLLEKVPAGASFPSKRGLLRSLELHIKKKSHIRSFLKNKIESSLLAEAVALRFWERRKGCFSFYGLKKSSLNQLDLSLQEKELSCDHLHPSSFAYAALINFLHPSKGLKIWICLTEASAEVLLFDENILVEGVNIEQGAFFETEILRSIFSMRSKMEHISEELGILGTSLKRESLLKEIKERTPFSTYEPPLNNLPKKYLLEVGSALILNPTKRRAPNFTLKGETYRSVYKQYRKPLHLSLILLGSLFLVHALTWRLQTQTQKHINQNIYSEILRMPSIDWKELPSLYSPQFEGERSIQNLDLIFTQPSKRSAPFPLRPNTFLVSETLAWLKKLYSQLPVNGVKRPFVLDHFEYKLVSLPSIKKPKAPYLVKVDMTFSASSPQTARQLHELLLKEKDFIQMKKKLSWSFQNNLYQASFYLKNYPNSISVQSCSKQKRH